MSTPNHDDSLCGRIADLIDAGESVEDVALMVDRTPRTVYRHIAHVREPLPPGQGRSGTPVSDDRMLQADEMYCNGATHAEIHRVTGMAHETITKYIGEPRRGKR